MVVVHFCRKVFILAFVLRAVTVFANDINDGEEDREEQPPLETVVVVRSSPSLSQLAEQDVCILCFESEVDEQLVCARCHKPMACRPCMRRMTGIREEWSVKCPFCREDNISLLRNEEIISPEYFIPVWRPSFLQRWCTRSDMYVYVAGVGVGFFIYCLANLIIEG